MKSFLTIASLCTLVELAQAQVPGFDISAYQETTDFAKAYADGDRFVIIKVSRPISRVILVKADHPRQPRAHLSRVASSVTNTTAPLPQVSSAGHTISPNQRLHQVLLKQSTSRPMAAVGLEMVSLCQGLWT